MTGIARGILITKYLVVRVYIPPARHSRWEMLHQDFYPTQEPSWKPSSKDAACLPSPVRSPWNSPLGKAGPVPHSTRIMMGSEAESVLLPQTTWNRRRFPRPGAYTHLDNIWRVLKWGMWVFPEKRKIKFRHHFQITANIWFWKLNNRCILNGSSNWELNTLNHNY